jgi:hypothetical protein
MLAMFWVVGCAGNQPDRAGELLADIEAGRVRALIQADAARSFDERPLALTDLTGREAWQVRLWRAVPLGPDPAMRWHVDAEEVDEVPCTGPDADAPTFADPVLDGGSVRFPADHRWCRPGSADIVLTPGREGVEVAFCETRFLARAGDSVHRRFRAAEDGWVAAEIARRELQQGSEPTRHPRRAAAGGDPAAGLRDPLVRRRGPAQEWGGRRAVRWVRVPDHPAGVT